MPGVVMDESQDVLMEAHQLRFQLSCSSKIVDHTVAKTRLMELIQANNMINLYNECCEVYKWKKDDKLVGRMEATLETEMKKLEEELKEAKESQGEIEVMEALLKIGQIKGYTGSKEDTLKVLSEIEELKSLSSGHKIDLELSRLRVGFFWSDNELIKSALAEADKLLEVGGDWDRRNRLKVYRALYATMCRDFALASENFLSAVATFTSYELCSYDTFIFYTIVTSIIALDRVEFKKKVIDAPEVLSVIHKSPRVEEFITHIHKCEYRGFFVALSHVYNSVTADAYLSTHRDWFVREMRVLAYRQFLASYKSVTMKSMAQSFGVSLAFLDKELSHFISALRLNAKIDKTSGVIETTRPLSTNAQYQSVIKQGDILLNRVQMLSRAINV